MKDRKWLSYKFHFCLLICFDPTAKVYVILERPTYFRFKKVSFSIFVFFSGYSSLNSNTICIIVIKGISSVLIFTCGHLVTYCL